jgi:hypothetical protein
MIPRARHGHALAGRASAGKRERMVEGKALRAIAEAIAAKGYRISHEGVAGVLRVSQPHPP